MVFTQINCAGKNIQWVHLGEKLVWQFSRELLLYGSGSMADFATATFRLTVNEYISAGSENKVNHSAAVKIVMVKKSAGDSPSAVDSTAGAQLINALLLSAVSGEITTPQANARLIPIKDASAYGNILHQSQQGNLMGINALLSHGFAQHTDHPASALKRIKAQDSATDGSLSHCSGAVGWAIYVQKVNGFETASHSTRCEMVAIFPNKANSGIQLKTFTLADGRVFPAHTTGADGSFSEFAVGFLRLSDVLDADGRLSIDTYTTADALVNPAELTSGKSAETPHSTGYAKRLKAIVSNSVCHQHTHSKAKGTLWWFPVGDGTVLEQGTATQTKNGEILEIQWAFDTAHHENGILEVI